MPSFQKVNNDISKLLLFFQQIHVPLDILHLLTNISYDIYLRSQDARFLLGKLHPPCLPPSDPSLSLPSYLHVHHPFSLANVVDLMPLPAFLPIKKLGNIIHEMPILIFKLVIL